MVVHNNIYKYKNFKYLDLDATDVPDEKSMAEMKAYWAWVENENQLHSYMLGAMLLHDAYFKGIIRRGDELIIKLEDYKDGGRFSLVFHGVKDYRTYKTSDKGKLTRKDVSFWQFAYDDIIIGDRLQYTFVGWQRDWRCQRSYICGIIECDSLEVVNE